MCSLMHPPYLLLSDTYQQYRKYNLIHFQYRSLFDIYPAGTEYSLTVLLILKQSGTFQVDTLCKT